jgi:hypothetical protein
MATTTSTIEPKVGENGAARAGDAHAHARRERALSRLVRQVGGRRTVFAATAGTFATGLWLGLFTIGLCIPTQAYRDRLMAIDPIKAGSPSVPEIFESLVVVAFAFTPTNLALLCCAAALVGCLGRLATTDDAEARALLDAHEDAKGTEAPTLERGAVTVSPLAPAITAITWGLFIYLIVVSGTVVVTGDPFQSTSPEQYLRMASSTSLLAFAVGWRPQFISQLVSGVCGSKLIGKG